MMKNTEILVAMLLTFNSNLGGAMLYGRADFPQCENISDSSEMYQCRLKECGYDENPGKCSEYDLMYYMPLLIKTGISLMIFIILLISVLIVKEVNKSII